MTILHLMTLYIQNGQSGQDVEESADKYEEGDVLIQPDVAEPF